MALGDFLRRLHHLGLFFNKEFSEKHRGVTFFEWMKHVRMGPRLPHVGALVVPSFVSEADLKTVTAAQGIAALPFEMLSRTSALTNWWCCEKLPDEYDSLVQLQTLNKIEGKQDGAVYVALLDVGFAEMSMCVLELKKATGESERKVAAQPQKTVSVKVLATETARNLGFMEVRCRSLAQSSTCLTRYCEVDGSGAAASLQLAAAYTGSSSEAPYCVARVDASADAWRCAIERSTS